MDTAPVDHKKVNGDIPPSISGNSVPLKFSQATTSSPRLTTPSLILPAISDIVYTRHTAP